MRNLLNIFLCILFCWSEGSLLNRANESLKQGEFCGRQKNKSIFLFRFEAVKHLAL